MNSIVMQRLQAIHDRENSNAFTTRDGHDLHYLEFGKGPHVVFIFPGMAEPAIKYWETASEIAEKGFRVFVLDHIGHGFSDHLLGSEDIEKLHVENFSMYVEQAIDWVQHLNAQQTWDSSQILGHSMGGLIGASVALRLQIPKLVLSCPMFAIQTKGLPRPLAVGLAKILPGTACAPLQKEYNQTNVSKNQVTNCPDRAYFFHELLKQFPETRRSGVTNSWVRTSLDYTAQFFENAETLKDTSILLFQATNDSFVRKDVTERICKRVPGIQYVPVSGAKHEVLMENNRFRTKVMSEIFSFLEGVKL